MIDELVGDSACADGLHKECLREGLKGRVVVFRKYALLQSVVWRFSLVPRDLAPKARSLEAALTFKPFCTD